MTNSERITAAVTAWPGVEAGIGERGEYGFTVGRKQIGHLHGDRVAHFGFPKSLGARLRAEGRIVPHPVFPENPGWGGRPLRDDEDVREAIALMRLNYERVTKGRAPERIRPSEPHALPFAPDLHVRSFVLERAAGDVLIYAAPGDPGGVARQYLGHAHEAMFIGDSGAPLFVNEHDREAAERHTEVAHSFSKRHVLGDDLEVIPIPGHTPGSTAYLWNDGGRRHLFTADTIYLSDGEWVAGLLESSDRASFAESLELLAGLDFDVLVPWAAPAGQPWYAHTDRDDARTRLERLLHEVRGGGD